MTYGYYTRILPWDIFYRDSSWNITLKLFLNGYINVTRDLKCLFSFDISSIIMDIYFQDNNDNY